MTDMKVSTPGLPGNGATVSVDFLEESIIYNTPLIVIFVDTTSAFQTCPKCSIYFEFCGA
ncbi:MAG: hypothetical protein ACI8ZB_004032 [Desulforhopalus sp.]|jgi:hypothetical protein